MAAAQPLSRVAADQPSAALPALAAPAARESCRATITAGVRQRVGTDTACNLSLRQAERAARPCPVACRSSIKDLHFVGFADASAFAVLVTDARRW
jgi:hypothetical protein